GPSIATRLMLSFSLVIVVISVAFVGVGIWLIRNRIVAEAQEKVRHDLNAAREIYQGELRHISDVVRWAADRTLLMGTLLAGNRSYVLTELQEIRQDEGLDVLTIADTQGRVLLRTSNPGRRGDDQSHDALVRFVLSTREPVAATMIVPAADLAAESPSLAERAHLQFIDTPMARPRPETEQTAGMMLKAAAPIVDAGGALIGVAYGGVLLNRDFSIVDEIKRTVFEDMTYQGQDIGTATIFQDDLRVSTNVRNEDGSRAIGTRVWEEVYDRVIVQGEPWIGRAFVVNNWYITAYEPIRDLGGKNIGILYVGLLEQKYVDLEKQTVLVFLAITLLGMSVALALSYMVARRISGPIHKLASASREVAQGKLDARVAVRSGDELGELAESFNVMASALQARDEQLKEFTTRKIMESERLALIGQLAANVAHELNNPLQGIVTYSHLLLERLSAEDATAESVRKVVTQADRCRDIIRGLLDFSRQRKPDKTVCSINAVLQECIALVENQALFHNIQIIEELQPDLPTAVIDPSQIERVFMNLIINAAEAMDGGGKLMLATRYDPEHTAIEIRVSDTGHGIPAEYLDRIFDPFFTTKDPGHGTGLGLAISYGIVKEHRGTISVESEPGKGTTFTVRLPMNGLSETVNRGNQAEDPHH
ncbi:MAG: cache domain-containing protein, partial [Chloroflexota bacterium]